MMRLAKSITTASAALVLGLGFAGGAMAQTPAPKPAQTMTMAPKPASQTAKKPVAPAKPATAPKQVAKAAPKAAPKTAAKPGATASPDQTPSAAPAAEANVAKRDPFVALVNNRKEVGGPVLPPGKAGLVVATVRVDGTVRSGADLIAVVSNPERHVYFVRPGDQLYDGTVEKIDLDGVTFHEDSKDAFGHPVVREVTKRIYASAGEQQ